MARIRSLKIGFFHNEDLAALSPFHRLLFEGLWLLADRAGRLEDRPPRIRAELFPYEPGVNVDPMLDDLAAGSSPLIRRYESAGHRCIQVVNFLKHQYPHPKEPASLIPEESSESLTKTQSRGKTGKNREKPEKPVCSSVLLSSVLGDLGSLDNGNGSQELPATAFQGPPPNWTHGHGRHGRAFSGDHRRCFPAFEACARGLCVPSYLGQQWVQQLGPDDPQSATEIINAFVADAVAQIPPGPVGDDPPRFWKAAWNARHGSQAPAIPSPHFESKGERQNRVFENKAKQLAAKGKP